MENLIGISGKKGAGKDSVGRALRVLEACKNEDNNLRDLIKYSIMSVKGNAYLGTFGDLKGYKIVKFADKLKDVVCILLNCTRKQLEDQEFKSTPLGREWWVYNFPNGKIESFAGQENAPDFWSEYLVKRTPRDILQLMGTECGKKILHPNIWVNPVLNNYSKEDKWVITDVRFPEEAKKIREMGGILIRVNRPKHRDFISYPCCKSEDGQCIRKEGDYCPEDRCFEEHKSETALDDYEDWYYVINNDGSIRELVEKVKGIWEQFV